MSHSSKFLFDKNNFDLPEEEEEIIIEEEIYVEPPPPTFSEDDLEASKAVAHAAGRNEGIIEERQKREEFISQVLKSIADNFSDLFAAETYRERQYEEEALRLALKVIDLLAPSLNNRLGEEALKIALKNVLKSQSEQSEIRIDVHPESTSEIDALIASIWPDPDNAPRYKVVADSDLKKGGCHISWRDGGMMRNPDKTANDIKTAIEALLVEQVMAKGNSPLTAAENNAITESDKQDSAPDAAAENTQDGENTQ